ncbi:MAG: outer membrane beta-barrel protein [Chitinophagaceae bacterium]
MKKLVLIALAFLSITAASAQKKKKSYESVLNRAGDHLVVQLSSDHWMGAPDSVASHIKSLSRGANIYFMLDKPFKGNPTMSLAFGLGIATSNIYFKNMGLDIKSTTSKLPFINQDNLDHFKKYKLNTTFLELPVELRYTLHPENEAKSFKAAIGIKVGTLLGAHTKGKSPLDKNGASINSYIAKENSKRFFNTTRLAATARIGYGHYTLFGSYQINNIFKDGVAAPTKLLQVGITLSGL